MSARPALLRQSGTEHPGKGASSRCQGTLTLSCWGRGHVSQESRGPASAGWYPAALSLAVRRKGQKGQASHSLGAGRPSFSGGSGWEAQGVPVPLCSAEVAVGGQKPHGQPLVSANTPQQPSLPWVSFVDAQSEQTFRNRNDQIPIKLTLGSLSPLTPQNRPF